MMQMNKNTITHKSPNATFNSIVFKNKENISALLISVMLALIFGFNSPLHPWIKGEAGVDSSVFKTVTMMMERGYMPYRDSFDHKGPVIYIFNWFGNRLCPYIGIWIIEIIAITITFFLMYKIARLSCGITASFISALTAVSLLFIYYEGGNFTEEYAMPCIAAGLYYFLDYLINNKINNKRIIISGICLGIVLMLRPNMISVWIVYCVMIAIVLTKKKEFKKLLGFALWFSLGIAVVIVPVLIWLIANNDLYYFFQDYIIFNRKYTSTEGGRILFSSKWSAFFHFSESSVYIIALFSILYHLRNKKAINISYLVYLVLTVVLMVMSGQIYGHYGMILVPAVVYPISLVFGDVQRIKETNTSQALIILISLYLLSVMIMPNWLGTIKGIASIYEKKDDISNNSLATEFKYIIENTTDEDDKISVYGNWDIIYVLSNRAHATRYSYLFPIGQVMPEIMDEYMESLQEELPRIIIVQNGRYDENIQSFLDDNDYQLRYSSNPNNQSDSYMLFIKK